MVLESFTATTVTLGGTHYDTVSYKQANNNRNIGICILTLVIGNFVSLTERVIFSTHNSLVEQEL